MIWSALTINTYWDSKYKRVLDRIKTMTMRMILWISKQLQKKLGLFEVLKNSKQL